MAITISIIDTKIRDEIETTKKKKTLNKPSDVPLVLSCQQNRIEWSHYILVMNDATTCTDSRGRLKRK